MNANQRKLICTRACYDNLIHFVSEMFKIVLRFMITDKTFRVSCSDNKSRMQFHLNSLWYWWLLCPTIKVLFNASFSRHKINMAQLLYSSNELVKVPWCGLCHLARLYNVFLQHWSINCNELILVSKVTEI